MMLLYEAFMSCAYCGARVLQKLRPDEAGALHRGRKPRRHCDFCVGQTEWNLLEWKSTPPSPGELEAALGPGADEKKRPPDRILVIDDDDLTAILLRKVLEVENCILEIANDGKEALQKLMEQRYALVICDIHMPGMDGKKLFKFVDDHALENKNLILFITGDTSAETRRFLEGTGCQYVHKPIQILQFAAKVREILEMNRAASAGE